MGTGMGAIRNVRETYFDGSWAGFPESQHQQKDKRW